MAQRYSKINQGNFAALVQNWKAGNPDESFYLRLFKKSEKDKETDQEMAKQMVPLEDSFLFCHQKNSRNDFDTVGCYLQNNSLRIVNIHTVCQNQR